MRKRNSMYFALTIISLVLTALWASPQPQGGPQGPPPGGHSGPPAAVEPGGGPGRGPWDGHADPRSFHFLARYLVLTEEQIASIEPLMQEAHETIRGIHEETRELEMELRDLVGSSSPDPATVGELVLNIHASRDRIQEVQAALGDSIEGLLEPAQLEKLQRAQKAAEVLPLLPAMRMLGLLPVEPPTAEPVPSS